jgi:hypothetical protein
MDKDQIPVAIVVKEEENEQEFTQNVIFLAKSMQGKTLIMNLTQTYKFLEFNIPTTPSGYDI